MLHLGCRILGLLSFRYAHWAAKKATAQAADWMLCFFGHE
jgi:hypothetical protein